MEQRTWATVVLMAYVSLILLDEAACRSHALKYHHHRSHLHNSYNNHNHHPHPSDYSSKNLNKSHSKHVRTSSSTPSWRLSEEDYEYEDGEGRHAYLMTKDNKKASGEKVTEDQTLTQAFEKHMTSEAANVHDVYAYQLPSDLWFMVRYSRKPDGRVDKYMNVVDSFTNYLEKLDKDVKTVSVNVKGIETVFRLTPKRKPDGN